MPHKQVFCKTPFAAAARTAVDGSAVRFSQILLLHIQSGHSYLDAHLFISSKDTAYACHVSSQLFTESLFFCTHFLKILL